MKYIIPFLLLSITSAAAQQGQAVGPYISPTNPVFSTSVTSPLHYGGSAAGSTATLSGTSNGSPSSAYVLLQNGTTQFVGINNATPKAPLDLNVNTASSPALAVSTSLARLQAADTAVGGMEFVSYGVNPANIVAGVAAGGTAGAPAFTPSSKNALSLRGYGYNGTTFQIGGLIAIHSVNQWAAGDQSTQVDTYTTPSTSTSLTLATQVFASGGLGIGAAAPDPGVGSLQVSADIFAPNLPTTAGALGAALCWTAATGRFQRDTNAGGCLVSSERYKHDIEPLVSTLDEVMSLKPVAFTYNDDVGIKGRQIGFLAEQAASVDERLVGFNPDGSAQSVRYMQMSAVLVGAIQQLKADNDNLRSCQQNWKCRIFGMGGS